MLSIKSLILYPVKSCKGIEVQKAEITRTGLKYDRHWMIVRADSGSFMTQRTHPQMALIETCLPDSLLNPGAAAIPDDAQLRLNAPDMQPLAVCLAARRDAERQLKSCKVWEWRGAALDEGDEAAEWLSEYLSAPVRLVRYLGDEGRDVAESGEPTRRPTDAAFAPDHETAFSDGYPVLLATEASRAELERVAGQELKMNRFRPNIVVAGNGPFDEDAWAAVELGRDADGSPLRLRSVKPCSRCKVTTVNQEDASVGQEPLLTMGKIRTGDVLADSCGVFRGQKHWAKATFFGWNMVGERHGVLTVGEEVRVVERRQ